MIEGWRDWDSIPENLAAFAQAIVDGHVYQPSIRHYCSPESYEKLRKWYINKEWYLRMAKLEGGRDD